MMPARAMKPIIEVAVKNIPVIQCPGRIPIRVSGIGAMMMSGVMKLRNQATTRT